MTDPQCVFCRIATGQMPVDPVFQNEEFLAFRDINPQAPVHVLVIPRAHYPTLMEVDDPQLLGRALRVVQETATLLGIDQEGFRTVINCRAHGGQTVFHLHIHVLGGRHMQWPPG